MIKLIRAFLTAGYMQEGQFYLQELGTPQGAVISPLLANIYLDPMDRWIAAQGRYELYGTPMTSSSCAAPWRKPRRPKP